MRTLRLFLVVMLSMASSEAFSSPARAAQGAVPPLPPAGHVPGPTLPDPSLPVGAVKAVLLPSWDNGNAPAWSQLNTQWPQFGPRPIVIDHSTLSGWAPFTYAQLAATGADVVIISNPAGGLKQYSQAEADAVLRYAREGHNVIGTFKLFRHDIIVNNALAPIFGLREDLRYSPASNVISNEFQILEATQLTRGLGVTGWTSNGVPSTEIALGGITWDVAGLAGAVPVAQCDGFKGIVSLFQTPQYVAIFISNMPEYTPGPNDKQLLYNAITFSAL